MQHQYILNAVLMLSLALSVNAGSVYKCTKPDNSVVFTDKPCPTDSEEKIFYTETEKDIKRKEVEQKTATIKKLIETNQTEAAKEFAEKNQAMDIYRTELTAHLNAKAQAEKQKSEEEKQKAETEKQQKNQLEQQKLSIQKQQLELQKKQVEIDKAKLEEQKNLVTPSEYNSEYNVYPYSQPLPYPYPQPFPPPPCQAPNYPYGCKPSPKPTAPPPPKSGLNPLSPLPRLPPRNPPSSGGLNPMSSP